MAWSHIQGNSNHNVTFNLSVVLGANPTPGNLVVVTTTSGGSTVAPLVSDGNSNSYTRVTTGNTSPQTDIYYLIAPANADKTISVNWGVTVSAFATVEEYHTTLNKIVFDKAVSEATGNSAAINLPSITPTNSGELLVAGGSSTNGRITSPTAGSTQGLWTGGSVTNGNFMQEYILSGGAGSTAVDMVLSSSDSWRGVVAAFIEQLGDVATTAKQLNLVIN